ncbi:MAG: hypothetical protein JXR18_13145 [Neptuniibacter sp.]
MDSDNEVNDRVAITKETFLSNEGGSSVTPAESYTLENAFQRTKNNSSLRLITAIALLMFVLMFVSASFHYYMRILESSVEINIAEFEDVHLKEALFSIGNTTLELDLLKADLNNLEQEYLLKKSDLFAEYSRLEQLAKIKGDASRLTQIETQKTMALVQLKEEWEALRASKQEEITKLETGNASAQQLLGDSKVDVLNPEQKLQSLKIKKVQEHYETKIVQMRERFQKEKKALILKYNPELSGLDSNLSSVLNKSIVLSGEGAFTDEQRIALRDIGAATDQQIKDFDETIKGQTLLLNEMRNIPFINMPQVASEQLNRLNQSILEQFTGVVNNLQRVLNLKSGEVGSYEFMMSNMVDRVKSDGLVVDPRDSSNIVVFLHEGHVLRKGDQFEVFRYETALNFRLVADYNEGELVLRRDKSGREVELLPFDKLQLVAR